MNHDDDDDDDDAVAAAKGGDVATDFVRFANSHGTRPDMALSALVNSSIFSLVQSSAVADSAFGANNMFAILKMVQRAEEEAEEKLSVFSRGKDGADVPADAGGRMDDALLFFGSVAGGTSSGVTCPAVPPTGW
uniref:Uncharacterized protein n=1 Tax=Trieres chinensis TaxID=1514140 RepID=A0A7S1YSK8_TRICV|mmetsp:Transcript_10044/g.21206  ORF Transcript_10044/g.21206 Transcript_10044/m.21206 type:complete len:134 (+) Transcript_10044:296-697(+)